MCTETGVHFPSTQQLQLFQARLGERTSAQRYNCFKQSACVTGLDESTVARSILPRSENVRNEVADFFHFYGDPVF